MISVKATTPPPLTPLTTDQFMELPIEQRREILTQMQAENDRKKSLDWLDIYFVKN